MESSGTYPPPPLLCHRCGYDLRASSPDASCPECGTPVPESTRPGLLHYAPPRWLGRLRRGAIAFLVVLAFALVGAALAAWFRRDWEPDLAMPLALFLVAPGVWGLTAPEAPDPDFPFSPRTLARVCLAMGLMLMGLDVYGFFRGQASDNLRLYAGILEAVGGIGLEHEQPTCSAFGACSGCALWSRVVGSSHARWSGQRSQGWARPTLRTCGTGSSQPAIGASRPRR